MDIQTRGWWVRSKYATSVLCSPLIGSLFLSLWRQRLFLLWGKRWLNHFRSYDEPKPASNLTDIQSEELGQESKPGEEGTQVVQEVAWNQLLRDGNLWNHQWRCHGLGVKGGCLWARELAGDAPCWAFKRRKKIRKPDISRWSGASF